MALSTPFDALEYWLFTDETAPEIRPSYWTGATHNLELLQASTDLRLEVRKFLKHLSGSPDVRKRTPHDAN